MCSVMIRKAKSRNAPPVSIIITLHLNCCLQFLQLRHERLSLAYCVACAPQHPPIRSHFPLTSDDVEGRRRSPSIKRPYASSRC